MPAFSTIEQPREMHAWADDVRRAGRRIGFVPTMGYLHVGHLSLVREAKQRADSCVVSIFVNPTQFGPREDLSNYPRNLAGDSKLLAEEGIDALYLPAAAAMYPSGYQTYVTTEGVTQGLCGRSRPTHFRGVTTVVTKLFNAVKPHVAVFGKKDFQQLATIERMVSDLDFDVEIVGAPIVREESGLAMSSRNAYLSEAERRAALCLFGALCAAREAFQTGERSAARLVEVVSSVVAREPLAQLDYAEIVDRQSLDPLTEITATAVVALAVYVGKTRLIDNLELVPA